MPQHRHVSCARMIQTRRNLTCVESHRCHGILTCDIEALRCVRRSVHGIVLNCVPTLALVVFTWHLDHRSATCRAVKCALLMSFTSAGARRSPVMHRLSMNLRLSGGSVAANVLLASSGVHSLTLFVSCATSLARMIGFAASPLFVRVDPSSSECFPRRLVQVAHKKLHRKLAGYA